MFKYFLEYLQDAHTGQVVAEKFLNMYCTKNLNIKR